MLFEVQKKIPKVKISNVVRTKNGRIMLLSEYAMRDSKKSKFIKQRKACRLLRGIGIETS